MTRVLIGWELGANRGHITAIRPIAQALLDRGCEVHLALQQIDASGLDPDPRIRLWQAPVWPRLFVNRPATFAAFPASMGDILGRLGLDTPGSLASLVRGWDALFSAIKPDLVISEFAPALLCAARGRAVTARMGNGFTTPPADLAGYPSLSGESTQFREDELLDIADADLRSAGRSPLASLPGIDQADHDLVRSFAEFDVYADTRKGGRVKLATPEGLTGNGPQGPEIFCYLPPQMRADIPLWQVLAASRRPVRIHMREASAAHRARFQELGFTFEPQPVPFTSIAARSAVAVSHGGHGFVTASALAGLPQIVIGFDLEKFVIGKSLTTQGIGAYANLFTLDAASLGGALGAALTDTALADRCRDFAATLASRVVPSGEERIAEIVDAL